MSFRIAIMGTRGIPNHYGGFEQLAEYLAPGLVQAGYEVTVYNSHNHPYREKEWKGVKIRHCYDPEYLLGSAGQFIYDLNCLVDARKQHFDVILQLGYTSSTVWGFLFPSGTTIIYHLDGLEWQRTKYSPRIRKFLLYAEKLAVKYSHFFIADHPVIQNYFREKYHIHAEYIAYGAELFGTADPGVLRPYGMPPGNYLLLMARMEPENNVEIILDGYAKSSTTMPLLMVGDTVNKFGKYLRDKFSEDSRIIFTGGIYDNWKTHCLRSFCHLYFHGHSSGGTNPSLLEAMASEALIVAHENPFNRQVLEGNALYFTNAEDVTRVADGLPVGLPVADMKRENRVRVMKDFNWPDVIARYEQFIIQSLTATGGSTEGQKRFARNERNILYRRYTRG
jgi:glycosyltransferase involved in cell wall biosynthesis